MASTKITDCVVALAHAFLDLREEFEVARDGCKLLITATHRTPEEQFKLFQIGRRQIADGSWVKDEDPVTQIVTHLDGYLKASKHNCNPSGALDFAVLVHGKVSWDPAQYEPVGALAEARGLVWGGRWKTLMDYPHLEVPD